MRTLVFALFAAAHVCLLACSDSPSCEQIVCDVPPAAVCDDALTLRTYAATGTCAAGECRYESATQTCEFGCDLDRCRDDPCLAVSCDSPPNPICDDALTLRTYAPTGTCAAGECLYESATQTCTEGCAAGQCRQRFLVNFDQISGVVTSQYAPEVSFSAPPGYVNRTWSAGSFGQSPPNYLCTGPTNGGVDCVHDTYLTFDTPVSGLTFRAIGTDATGPVATVRVFHENAMIAELPLMGSGSNTVPVVVNLGGYSGITRLELVQITDPYGIAWDDFAFSVP